MPKNVFLMGLTHVVSLLQKNILGAAPMVDCLTHDSAVPAFAPLRIDQDLCGCLNFDDDCRLWFGYLDIYRIYCCPHLLNWSPVLLISCSTDLMTDQDVVSYWSLVLPICWCTDLLIDWFSCLTDLLIHSFHLISSRFISFLHVLTYWSLISCPWLNHRLLRSLLPNLCWLSCFELALW